MIVSKDIKKLFSHLLSNEVTEIAIDGMTVSLQILESSSKVSLSTAVYEGGNYIPKSVRKCLSEKVPFDHKVISTFLKVDEPHFQISLNYLGSFNQLNQQSLLNLLEEFSELANEWRFYLDEHDKNDLVHVYAAK